MKKNIFQIAKYYIIFYIFSLLGLIVSFYYKNRIPYKNHIINTKSRNITPFVKATIYLEKYEESEINFVSKHMKPDYCVIELGSSIGIMAGRIAKIIDPNDVICIEANPQLIPIIDNNLKSNSISNYSILNFAISYQKDKSTVRFYKTRSNELGFTNEIIETIRRKGITSIEVPKITLSEILKKFNIQDFILVCDIEGAEIELLIKDKNSLKKCKQIFIECHSTNFDGKYYSVDDMKSMILELGFTLLDNKGVNFVFDNNKKI